MAGEIAPAWYIKTRPEFFEVLARTLNVAGDLSASRQFWTYESIAAQLRAMTEWTAAGRTPTPEERDQITIGLIAIREFDAEPVGEEAEFMECLIQLAGYFDEWPDDPVAMPAQDRISDSLSPGLQLLLQRRIGLMSAAVHLPAGAATRASLHSALSANAEHVRLPGLPDSLNPMILDTARVEAFIEGLVRQPETVLRRLESRFLALGIEGLHLAASSPVPAEAIADGFDLVVGDEDGLVVDARMRVPLRLDYAQGVVAQAKTALHQFEDEVLALEAGAAVHFELMQAKWRRFAAAAVWRTASRALAEESSRFRADAKKAVDAVKRYLVPPWVGLPPR